MRSHHYVSLPPPEVCDSCCSPNVSFKNNEEIYGVPRGEWPYVYHCSDCKASVGCHARSNSPLGYMADAVTRRLRKRAHDEFDKLWSNGLMTRMMAYEWLARELCIPFEQCHIAQLSKDQLSDVATLSANFLSNNFYSLVQRRIKRDAKQQRNNERDERAAVRNYDSIIRRKSKKRTKPRRHGS